MYGVCWPAYFELHGFMWSIFLFIVLVVGVDVALLSLLMLFLVAAMVKLELA